jgi:hypothetical protein
MHFLFQDGRTGRLASLARGMTVSLQIGINTGWVVEAILGKRLLPRYKLFGDCVNTASRMKSTGVYGRICASRATRDLLMRDAESIIESLAPTSAVRGSALPTLLSERSVDLDHGATVSLRRIDSYALSQWSSAAKVPVDQPQFLSSLDIAFAQATGFFFRPRPMMNVRNMRTTRHSTQSHAFALFSMRAGKRERHNVQLSDRALRN